MATSQWDIIQEIFLQATALSKEDRAKFLEVACENDNGLLAEVRSLLECDERVPDDFMKPNLIKDQNENREQKPIDKLIGTTISQFNITRLIGSGGMGAVYLAEQANPKRLVALKISYSDIRAKSIRRRFEHEIQILAWLHHPHIAQVYEAGIHVDESGTNHNPIPYFAMEYVHNAETIVVYANKQKLPIKEGIKLFLQACEAIEHGHRKGVIHRDLKPANILVDASGCVKVIDFGIAKATDSDISITTIQTDTGNLIGTVQYMSPEQCNGNPHSLDSRSDVYTLGVVLYELLCGRLPYEDINGGIHTIIRAICEQFPQPLHLVDRKLRGDLETIVLKALEKDREKRYQSVADLAKDLQRYLNREPIEARPPTVWNRFIKCISRHPIVSTSCAACFIAACIIATTLFTTWWYTQTPHSITKVDDLNEYRLLSVGDTIMHSWSSANPHIGFARLMNRPSEFGGGRIAVIGYGPDSEDGQGGGVCAYDVGRGEYTNPLWTNQAKNESIPKYLKEMGRTEEKFGAQEVFIHDIFPEVPGKEILAVFAAQSQRCVRIIDLSGKTRYQVWYDGVIDSSLWMEKPGLLILSGESSVEYLQKRGFPNSKAPYPDVVFAIKPRLDFITKEFISEIPGEIETSPVWFRFVMYPFDQVMTTASSLRCDLSHQTGNAIGYSLKVIANKWPTAGMGWLIDVNGNEIPNTRWECDYYRTDSSLPNPSRFYLSDTLESVEEGGNGT